MRKCGTSASGLRESGEEPVTDCALLMLGSMLVADHAGAALPRAGRDPRRPCATSWLSKINNSPRVSVDFLLDPIKRDAAVGEERDLLGQAGELQTTTEPRGGLDAGQYG